MQFDLDQGIVLEIHPRNDWAALRVLRRPVPTAERVSKRRPIGRQECLRCGGHLAGRRDEIETHTLSETHYDQVRVGWYLKMPLQVMWRTRPGIQDTLDTALAQPAGEYAKRASLLGNVQYPGADPCRGTVCHERVRDRSI